MKRALLGTAGGFLCLVLPGCGGSSSTSTPTPVATPQPCTQSVILQDAFAVPVRTIIYEDFTTTVTARMDVIVDWTHADSAMGVYVVPKDSCSLAAFNNRSCNFIIRSERSNIKPRKVTASAVSPAAYDLFVVNFNTDQKESISTQVISSTSTCPALAANPGDGSTIDLANDRVGAAIRH